MLRESYGADSQQYLAAWDQFSAVVPQVSSAFAQLYSQRASSSLLLLDNEPAAAARSARNSADSSLGKRTPSITSNKYVSLYSCYSSAESVSAATNNCSSNGTPTVYKEKTGVRFCYFKKKIFFYLKPLTIIRERINVSRASATTGTSARAASSRTCRSRSGLSSPSRPPLLSPSSSSLSASPIWTPETTPSYAQASNPLDQSRTSRILFLGSLYWHPLYVRPSRVLKRKKVLPV